MPRKPKGYPNSSWGREAQWEDEQGRIQHGINNDTYRTYVDTYEAANRLRGEGCSPSDIHQALHRPPTPFSPGQPKLTIAQAVEEGLAKVRLEAITDVLNGRPNRETSKSVGR